MPSRSGTGSTCAAWPSAFSDMFNISRELALGALDRRGFDRAPGDRRGAGLLRRHQENGLARFPRAGPPPVEIRDGLHSRRGPRHVVHFEPGRLHADLLLLPHGSQKLGRKPDRGRDLAQLLAAATARRLPDRDTPDGAIVPAEWSQGLQHRHDGHGEPALQLRERQEALLIGLRRDGRVSSKRRITLSTSACAGNPARREEIGVMLAISLHATK